MTTEYPPEVMELYRQQKEQAEAGGYHLNQDLEDTLFLVAGLNENRKRYGYMVCPCRVGEGNEQADLDIICPCDYRDPDLDDYGACYCGYYVSPEVLEGKQELRSIPERRPEQAVREQIAAHNADEAKPTGLPVWRCKVCGYLCAREKPPAICPICKAQRERFEIFHFTDGG